MVGDAIYQPEIIEVPVVFRNRTFVIGIPVAAQPSGRGSAPRTRPVQSLAPHVGRVIACPADLYPSRDLYSVDSKSVRAC